MSGSFQDRVAAWMSVCFGTEISANSVERNHRFLEEALELVQSCHCTRAEAHQLVDYVFNRAIGDRAQEVGGVLVTLAALCNATGEDMSECGEVELTRCWQRIDRIRAKQAAKPKHSPLPTGSAEPTRDVSFLGQLRQRAISAGIRATQNSDGDDGDALAALFPRSWWVIIPEPGGMAGEHGPYASETAALQGGLTLVDQRGDQVHTDHDKPPPESTDGQKPA